MYTQYHLYCLKVLVHELNSVLYAMHNIILYLKCVHIKYVYYLYMYMYETLYSRRSVEYAVPVYIIVNTHAIL
jgi:hypothetical protein